jgi:exodeoxyribonuclease VII large subunit
LFQASMQGDSVEAEVLAALSSIHQSRLDFDVVVLIRGGGASLDLTAFDNYEIAKRIAQFPLPVITGIGHERDGTVVDMVAHTSLKTPTAVAAFLIEQFEEFEEYTKELADSLVYLVKDRLLKQKNKTKKIRSSFALLSQGFIAQKKEENFRLRSSLKVSCLQLITRKKEMLTGLKNKGNACFKDALVKTKQDLAVSKIRLKRGARELVQKNKVLISNQGRAVKLLDPINVLSRGYAMVQRKDKTFVKSITHLKNGDELRLTLKDGSVAVKLEENHLKRKIKKK